MSNLFEFSIYTMRHSAELKRQSGQPGPYVLNERKAWITGYDLWQQAHRAGQAMPIIFSAADEALGLIYWAVVEDIAIDDETRETTCRYSGLRPIERFTRLSTLRLKASGRPLSDDYIRPYAICHTPTFVA